MRATMPYLGLSEIGVTRKLSTRVVRRRGSLLQSVPIPNGAFARVAGHFEVLRQLETVGGAGVLAKPAEHAARSVISEMRENLAPRSIVALPAHHNQVFRASQRAQIARNAQRLPSIRIDIQPRRPAIA